MSQRSDSDNPVRFELPEQAVSDEGTAKKEEQLRSEVEAGAKLRTSRGGQRREVTQTSPTEAFVYSARGDTDELPTYFRRRSDALPGTYDRTGKVSPWKGNDSAGAMKGLSSSAPQDREPAWQMTPSEQASLARQKPLDEAQNAREPAWMRRAAAASGEPRALTAADEAVIRDLKKLEREVMGREMEQARAGGGVTGKARHVVETGPDGVRYVTGGVTSPSLIRGGTAEQELERARAARRAAQAPVSPSSRDLAVASEAARIERAAEREIQEEVDQAESVSEEVELKSVQSFADLAALSSARREELRTEEARSAVQRAEAREGLEVAAMGDPTIPNAEVVALKREVAIDAYLTQV